MNTREIGEIRRRVRRDRSNMTAIYGCYVNDNKEIIAEFRQSTAMMSENEADKYFGLLKRALSGTIGKNLIDIIFTTAQVAGSPEHKLLMDLRKTALADDSIRHNFYQKVIETSPLDGNYVIIMGCDTYDVPFKSKDGDIQADNSADTYTYLLFAICPVKQTKPTLHYVPQDKEFHDGNITNVVSAPELGFLFPAFDDRATNIYNALYYTHSPKESHEAFVSEIFRTNIPKPAAEQKKSFAALLNRALEDECDLDVVQTIHDQLCQRIAIHKESRVPDTLLVSKSEVKEILETCGVAENRLAKFSIDYDEAFGFEADLYPKNIIDNRRLDIHTPDVSIQVSPERSDLIETRVIDGVKYILIQADGDVEVNGVSIHIAEKDTALV